jgi:hypothetical protein
MLGNPSNLGNEGKGIPSDPNLVDWDGQVGPENPQNMPYWKKWFVTMTLSLMTLWISFTSSVFSASTSSQPRSSIFRQKS